jgi:hypothetical protein
MSAEAAVFEHIATTRLPQLQTAGGLFRATPRVDQVGEEDAGPDAGTLGAGAIVLLGLLRADEVGLAHPFSTGALRTRILGDLGGPGTDPGELGLTLWAESRADGGAIGEITKLISREAEAGFERTPLEQLAWLVSGLTAASERADGERTTELLDRAEEELLARTASGTGLMHDPHHRIGGGLTPIAGQFHSLIALEQLVRSERGESDREPARRLATALLDLQRDDGSWPGIVDSIRGEAAALYPVLTVTQVALAPIALRGAGNLGLEGDFDAAVRRSLAWAGGANRLGFNLIHEQEARLDRGILPRREPGAFSRGLSTAARRLRGRLAEPEPDRLILDPEVSSEDLGWLLEAWAGR